MMAAASGSEANPAQPAAPSWRTLFAENNTPSILGALGAVGIALISLVLIRSALP